MRARVSPLTLVSILAAAAIGAAMLRDNQRVNANPFTGVAAVSAGSATCVVTTAGGAKCWRGNEYGQVGNGTYSDIFGFNPTPINAPVDVTGLSTGVTAISAGNGSTCAVTTGGGVKCWGYAGGGQLGDGSGHAPELCNYKPCSTTPVDVTGLSSVTAVSVGVDHACALTTGGGVKCWGTNNYGQLGNGTTINGDTPVDVSGLTSGAVAISAGAYNTCALTKANGVKCWGAFPGSGLTMQNSTPVDVSGLTSGIAAISVGGDGACVLTTSGGVKCWGVNEEGELGNGTRTASSDPVDVSGLTSGVAAIDVGGQDACALTVAGGVKCWGYNGLGELGIGTMSGPEHCTFPCSTLPMDVNGLTGGVSSVSIGFAICALTTAGQVKCWGPNLDGNLGTGNNISDSTTPVDVVALSKRLNGDVNCDGLINAIDAYLVLQHSARGNTFFCPQNADVNQDRSVNPIDATLILQFDAGLLRSLPP